MEAKHFMVGDWVLNDEGVPFRVAQVNDACYGEHTSDLMLENGEEYKEVQPIPLTKEIVEKNGIDAPEFFKGYWIMENKDGSFFIEDHNTMTLRYVHELQHALKLCGIDKEIVSEI